MKTSTIIRNNIVAFTLIASLLLILFSVSVFVQAASDCKSRIDSPASGTANVAKLAAAAINFYKTDQNASSPSSIADTVCDVDCESVLCSCLGLELDRTTSSWQNTLAGGSGGGVPAFCTSSSSLKSGSLSTCISDYKTCRNGFLQAPPSSSVGAMSGCSSAITTAGDSVSNDACAYFACAFTVNLTSSASGAAKYEDSLITSSLDLSTACGISVASTTSASGGETTKAGGEGGGGPSTTEAPFSSLISSILSSVISSFVESAEKASNDAASTTSTLPPTPAPTTVTTIAATTTPEPTPAAPAQHGQQLQPGLVQMKYANGTNALKRTVDAWAQQQKPYVLAKTPDHYEIEPIVDLVSGGGFQISWKVTGTDDNTAKEIEDAFAQQLSDAINNKNVYNPALAGIQEPVGRAPLPTGPPWPTLPDPLNPPAPKMEELPVGAVIGGIIGGIVVGLVAGGLVAHYFCSKVEVLPLRDRLMPTGDDDDDDSDEEEEEEDDEDEDDNNEEEEELLTRNNFNVNASSRNANNFKSPSSHHPRTGGGSGGGGGGNRNYQARDMIHDEGTALDLLNLADGSPKRNQGAGAGAGSSSSRRGGGGGGGGGGGSRSGSNAFSPREGLPSSPSSSSRHQHGGGGGSSSGSRRGGGGGGDSYGGGGGDMRHSSSSGKYGPSSTSSRGSDYSRRR